jgi:hypothetical protein
MRTKQRGNEAPKNHAQTEYHAPNRPQSIKTRFNDRNNHYEKSRNECGASVARRKIYTTTEAVGPEECKRELTFSFHTDRYMQQPLL